MANLMCEFESIRSKARKDCKREKEYLVPSLMKQLGEKPRWIRDTEDDVRLGLIMSYRFGDHQIPLGFFERLVCAAAATSIRSSRKRKLQMTGLYRDAADLYVEGFAYRLILDEVENKIDVKVRKREAASRVRIHLSMIVRQLQDIFTTTQRSNSFVDIMETDEDEETTTDDDDDYGSVWSLTSWPKLMLTPNHTTFTDKFSQHLYQGDAKYIERSILNGDENLESIPISSFDHWFNVVFDDNSIDTTSSALGESHPEETKDVVPDDTSSSMISATFKLKPPLIWHVFLSHKQQNASGIAHVLHLLLEKRRMKCWRDMCQDASLQGMTQGVCSSCALLLVLTAGVLTRMFL